MTLEIVEDAVHAILPPGEEGQRVRLFLVGQSAASVKALTCSLFVLQASAILSL